MGDATKCEYCKRGTDIERRDDFCHAAIIRPLGGRSPISEAECAAITRVRAPLDTEIARLTAEVATLRARLEEAEARWQSAERQCNNWHCEVPGCSPIVVTALPGITVTSTRPVQWSPADRERRCTEHTTREGAELDAQRTTRGTCGYVYSTESDGSRTVCNREGAAWSGVDCDERCPEHTTREGAEETKR